MRAKTRKSLYENIMTGIEKSFKQSFEEEYNVVINTDNHKQFDRLAKKYDAMSDGEYGYYLVSPNYEEFLNEILTKYYNMFDEVFVYVSNEDDGWTPLFHIDHRK